MSETIGMGAIPFVPRYVPMAADENEPATIAHIRKELDTEPPKNAIESKDGYDYLHSYYVFAWAEQVFGALNIAYLHRASKMLYTGTAKTRSGDRDYVVCEATAGVIIALPGDRVYYTEGTATCDGMGKGYGDALNIAQKGAYSDARKLALRPLGKTFGAHFSIKDPALQSLKDRADIEATTRAKPKPVLPPELKQAWVDLGDAGSALKWDRRQLDAYIKSKHPDKPAAELTKGELLVLYADLAIQIDARAAEDAKSAGALADNTAPSETGNRTAQPPEEGHAAPPTEDDTERKIAWGKLYKVCEHGGLSRDDAKVVAREAIKHEFPNVKFTDLTIAQLDAVRNVRKRKNEEADEGPSDPPFDRKK